MLGPSAAVRVYLAPASADMRKSFGHTQEFRWSLRAGLRPRPRSPSGYLFVFINKQRNRIKILYWGRDELAVRAKRLERGH